MSVYKANSWGRTRRPKDMVESVPASYQGDSPAGRTKANCQYVTDVSHFSNTLASATEGRNGYSTENQRFLHLFIKHNTSGTKQVTVYGFNYAFGEWAPLYLPLGSGDEAIAEVETFSSGASRLYIFDVSGVDRVGFYATNTDKPDRIRAAMSSF
jgi:hypothetical protein